MKKRTSIVLTSLAAIIAMSIVAVSCNKKFDAPPLYVVPNITANKTIAQLKSVYTTAGTVLPITDSSIISGIVVANDKSGNIYKVLYIQDASGGIALKLNATNLYASYPVGMQIFIKCNGLALSDYNGSMELGSIDNSSSPAVVTGIPSTLIMQYITAGSTNNAIVPKVVTIAQLNSTAKLAPYLDTLQNTLVQINNAEYAATDTGYVYADTSAAKGSVNRNVEDCGGGKSIFYNSGFADFAGVKLPSGNGTILAIPTPYKAKSELILRDTSDVQFTGARCTSGGGGGGGGGTAITLAQLRAMYTGADVTLASGTQITGVVISDAANKNISTGNVIIEQNGVGMSVYFGGTITYHIGDSIVITAGTGYKLTSYKGSLEVSTPVGSTKPTPVSTGNVVTPQVVTVTQLLAGLAKPLSDPTNIEYTLVQIQNATASSSNGNYSASATISDGTSMTLYTASAATFYGTALPTGAKTWTGYANNFNTTHELQIRNPSDVQP